MKNKTETRKIVKFERGFLEKQDLDHITIIMY